MNFWLYVALEFGLLALVVVAIVAAFREVTSEEPENESENEST